MAWNLAIKAELGELLTKLLDTGGWVVQSLAWPVAAVVMVLLLRTEIRGLFKRLRRGTWGGAEFHFEEGVNELVSQRVEEEVATGDTGEAVGSGVHAKPEDTPVAATTENEEAPAASPTPTPSTPQTSATEIAFKRPLAVPKRGRKASSAHPIFRRLKEIEKPQGKWETYYKVSGDVASLALISPRAGIARAWSLLEKELTRFAPNPLASALSLIPPSVAELLTSEELTRIVNLKSLASELASTDAEPSHDAAFSFIELAEELRLKLKSHRLSQEIKED